MHYVTLHQHKYLFITLCIKLINVQTNKNLSNIKLQYKNEMVDI